MPKIPLPQVALQTGSTPDFAAPSLGVQMPDIAGRQISAFGQSLAEFGSGISSVAHVVQDKVDRAARLIQNQVDDSRTKSAYTKFAELATEEMVNPKSGFLNQIGSNATEEAFKSTLERLGKNRADLEKGLDNDMQRSMFKEAIDTKMIGIQQQGYVHLADQTLPEAIGQADAYIKQVTSDAANAHRYGLTTDQDKIAAAGAEQYATGRTEWLKDYVTIPQEPNNAKSKQTNSEYDRQVNTLRTAVHDFANLKGWSEQDPRRKNLLLEKSTDMNSQIFDNYIGNGRNAAAAKFVATLSLKDVDSSVLSKMQSTVKRVTDLDNGVRIAMSVMDLVNNKPKPKPTPPPSWKPGGGLSAESSEVSLDSNAMPEQADVPQEDKFGGSYQQEAVDGINHLYKIGQINLEERGSALDEIDSTHRRLKNSFEDNKNEALRQAENLLNRNSDLRINSSQFPAKLHDQLSRYSALDDAAKFESGLPIETTPENYALAMKARDNGILKDMSFSELSNKFRSILSKEDFKDLQSYHATLNGSKGESSDLADKLAGLTASENLRSLAFKYDLIKGDSKPADDRVMAIFSLLVLESLRKSAAEGVKLTPEFRDQTAVDIILNRSFTSSWWGSKTYYLPGQQPSGEKTYIETRILFDRLGNVADEGSGQVFENKPLNPSQQGILSKLDKFAKSKEIDINYVDMQYLAQELTTVDFENLKKIVERSLGDNLNNKSVKLLFIALDSIKKAKLPTQPLPYPPR